MLSKSNGILHNIEAGSFEESECKDRSTCTWSLERVLTNKTNKEVAVTQCTLGEDLGVIHHAMYLSSCANDGPLVRESKRSQC
jgi:hypothetical protein